MKLTKQHLKQLIKEELTLTPKAPFDLIPKDIIKKIDLELKPKADFKLKPKKFSSFVKSLPLVGRAIGNLLDIPDLMRLDQVYKEQGTEAALKELGRFAMGFAPGVGELMIISDLADRYQDKKLKAIADAFYKPLGGDGAKISAERGQPRLTRLKPPRVGVNPFKESNMKLTKQSLKQLIREVLQEQRKQYLCYQEWMDLKETDPREHEKLGRNMRRDFSRANIDEPTEAQMNRWLSKYGNCRHNPSVVDVVDVDKPQ
jgi:hypothetical protein